MPAAGFIGIGRAHRHSNGVSAGGTFQVSLTGLTDGAAAQGATLGFDLSGTGAPQAQQWQTSATGGVWLDIAGVTAATETIDITGGRHSDGDLIRVRVTRDGVAQVSAPVILRHIAPALAQPLADQVFTVGDGIQVLDASLAFDGAALGFSLAAPAGVSIDVITGEISIDTDQMPEQADSPVTVTASNSGGSVSTGFTVTIEAVSAFALEDIAAAPVITAENGALTITLASGPYAGTYTTDSAGTPLTVSSVTAAPANLRAPQIAGFDGLGSTLTITPGLWLYAGEDQGDQSWQHQVDGVDITGGTGLTHGLHRLGNYRNAPSGPQVRAAAGPDVT